jgi:large subunit ribosomal protein L24
VAARIRKGDEVIVISGPERGKTGTVMEVRPKDERVVVEGVNIRKRHTRARPPEDPGGIIEFPGPMHLSNVALIDPVDKRATRVRTEVVDGKKVRVAVRSGEHIDKS